MCYLETRVNIIIEKLCCNIVQYKRGYYLTSTQAWNIFENFYGTASSNYYR